jgi:hypothetical protein
VDICLFWCALALTSSRVLAAPRVACLCGPVVVRNWGTYKSGTIRAPSDFEEFLTVASLVVGCKPNQALLRYYPLCEDQPRKRIDAMAYAVALHEVVTSHLIVWVCANVEVVSSTSDGSGTAVQTLSISTPPDAKHVHSEFVLMVRCSPLVCQVSICSLLFTSRFGVTICPSQGRFLETMLRLLWVQRMRGRVRPRQIRPALSPPEVLSPVSGNLF